MKKCNKCNEYRDLTAYGRDKRNQDGLQGICEVCRKTSKKASRKTRIINGPENLITEKTCNKCYETKPVSLFYKDGGISDGYATICKTCKNKGVVAYRNEERAYYNEYMRLYRKTHPVKYERERARSLRNRYKLTPEEYDLMLASQGGRCAIPSCTAITNDKPLYVDHDHKTGLVRGLLCPGHNRSIALLDDADLLLKAVAYLENHKKKSE